jgi:hypothetical protein
MLLKAYMTHSLLLYKSSRTLARIQSKWLCHTLVNFWVDCWDRRRTLASHRVAADALLELNTNTPRLSDQVLKWLSTLLRPASEDDNSSYCAWNSHLIQRLLERVDMHGAATAAQVFSMQDVLVAISISRGETEGRGAEALCYSLLKRVKLAYENGWVSWDAKTVKRWSPSLKSLLMSRQTEHQQLYHDFWYASHDKLGSDCFPEDQVDAINESLGLLSAVQEDDIKAVAQSVLQTVVGRW